jgi:organic hydroperoxide reductase OsmC/OhrA
MGTHIYSTKLTWTGAGQGTTSSYQAYSREYEVQSGEKPPLRGSADPLYRGDPTLYNPEEMLVIALSACHMLSYMAECARGGEHVMSYEDDANGAMAVKDGRMRIVDVLLRPRVAIARGSDIERARALHERAHEECFIANSVNFPVRHEATVSFAD